MTANREINRNETTAGFLHRAGKPVNWNSLPKLAAVITLMLGLTVLAGWLFSVPLLKSVLPGAVEMKSNTTHFRHNRAGASRIAVEHPAPTAGVAGVEQLTKGP